MRIFTWPGLRWQEEIFEFDDMPTSVYQFDAENGTDNPNLSVQFGRVVEANIFCLNGENPNEFETTTVTYELETIENETFLHVYEFDTGLLDFDRWATFFDLITSTDRPDTLIYYAIRNRSAMYEFSGLCTEANEHAAAA